MILVDFRLPGISSAQKFKIVFRVAGLVHKRLEQYEEALDFFLKLHAIMSSHPPVLYQLAHLHQLVGDIDQAIEW